MFGIKDIDIPIKEINKDKFEKVKLSLTALNYLFDSKRALIIPTKDMQFLEDSRRATTDTKVRLRRTKYLLEIINSI